MSSAVHVRDSYRNWNCSRARLKLLKIALKAGPPTSVRMTLWRGWLYLKTLTTMRRRTLILRLNGPQSNGRRYASLHPATHGIRVNLALMEMISLRIMMRKTIFFCWRWPMGSLGALVVRIIWGMSIDYQQLTIHVKAWVGKKHIKGWQHWSGVELQTTPARPLWKPVPSPLFQHRLLSRGKGTAGDGLVSKHGKSPPSLLASEFKLLVDWLETAKKMANYEMLTSYESKGADGQRQKTFPPPQHHSIGS